MNQRIATNSIFVAIAVALLSHASDKQAAGASVTFTAGVPNGTTQLNTLVKFSVGNPDGSFSSDDLSLGSGVTGNNVVSTMEMELENFSSFEGDVSGNMLTVENASTAAVVAHAELDLSFEINTMGEACTGCMLDLPFAIEPRHTERSLILILAGVDGQSVPFATSGMLDLVVELSTGSSSPVTHYTFENAWPVSPSTTTGDILQSLDAALISQTLPTGIRYLGLTDGFPTLGHDDEIEILSFSWGSTLGDSGSGVVVGAAAIGAVPEPSSGLMALVMGVVAYCWIGRGGR